MRNAPMHLRVLVPLLGVVLTFGASVAFGCFNDTDSRAGEDEFRSRYEAIAAKDGPAPAYQGDANDINLWGTAGLAAGSGFIAGSSLVSLRRRRQQRV